MYSIRGRIGHLIENVMSLKLLRKELHSELPDIYYDVINNTEIDFRNNNELYEVKYLKEDLNEELARYDIIDKKIKVIIKDLMNFDQDLTHYEILKLLEFLKD